MSKQRSESVAYLDSRHLWHPYASVARQAREHKNFDELPYVVERAQGCHLTLSDERRLIDGMSSWWSTIHGYNHPVLNKAMHRQMEDMSHVMFGGLTHAPAATLAQTLASLTPGNLNKVFFSDSGSVAVEVAMKMALQYWRSKGHTHKTQFVSHKFGYHGDTFAAMSLCDPITGMHTLFEDVLMKSIFAEAPGPSFDAEWSDQTFKRNEETIRKNAGSIAAVVIEPIVQGAGGMRFYHPHYLKSLRALCTELDILFIADEIATGFGRSGKLFACEHAEISPDIMCLGKALTGGTMSFAATLCSDEVALGICEGEAKVLMHGPTFMANPLACSVANASIGLLLSSDWQSTISNIEHQLRRELAACIDIPGVADVRSLGAIGVVEMESPVDIADITPRFARRGVWLRPFGKLIYTMPPYIIKPEELSEITQGIVSVLEELSEK